ALHWLDRRPGTRFALFLHYLDTHTPYRPPAADAAPFADPGHRGQVGAEFGDVAGARAGRYDAGDRTQIVALYDGALHFVDRELGRLLDGLASRGLLDSTLVIVTADHGDEQWEHGSFFHGQSLYDELLHVPLLVRLPGAAHAGAVIAEQVRSIDIVPTIAEALALPAAAGFQGASLLPLVAGTGSATPRPLFARAANPELPYRFAVRTPAHKLILTVGSGLEELYDLRADPRETHSLTGDPAAAATLAPLRALMDVFRRELDESGLHVRAVARDGTPHRVEASLTVSPGQVIDNPDRIGLAPDDRLVLGPDARTLTWSGTVGTSPAGIRLDAGQSGGVAPDLALDVRLQVDGVDVSPSAVYLAGDGTHPPTVPFTYKRVPPTLVGKASETPSLLAAPPPELHARDEEPVSFFLWRYPDAGGAPAAAPAVDDEVRRRLRALGYLP
ncbi:MAG TPA: sulfatase-like hydrolase/transferase, partial [Solirubrobacteraceae bacterium]